MTASALESHAPMRTSGLPTHARRVLDATYAAGGYAAAACILLILLTTLVQIGARSAGITVLGLTSYAGYLMAASTFLGLAHALNAGSHIRIETIGKLLGKNRYWLDLVAFAIGSAVAVWFAWHSCNMVYLTYVLNDISSELDATPLWIPQATMAVGTVVFAIAMLDNVLNLLLTGHHRIQANSEAL